MNFISSLNHELNVSLAPDQRKEGQIQQDHLSLIWDYN